MLKKLLITLFFVAVAGKSHAQDASAGFSHDYELLMANTGLTLAGEKMLDSDKDSQHIWWAAPAMVLSLDLMYRAPEMAGPDGGHYAHEFLTLDVPGVALGVLVEILFPPVNKPGNGK